MAKELNEHEVAVQALLETMEELPFKNMYSTITEQQRDALKPYLDALIQANQLCRSMNSIAEREGKQTNWVAFKKQLSEALLVQHQLMYPKTNQNG